MTEKPKHCEVCGMRVKVVGEQKEGGTWYYEPDLPDKEELERVAREFIPHSVHYCIKELATAIAERLGK